MSDRVATLVAWAEERIHECRRVEANLGAYADDTYFAANERVVLMQVLTILGYPIPPRDEQDLRYRGTAAAMASQKRGRGRKAT